MKRREPKAICHNLAPDGRRTLWQIRWHDHSTHWVYEDSDGLLEIRNARHTPVADEVVNHLHPLIAAAIATRKALRRAEVANV